MNHSTVPNDVPSLSVAAHVATLQLNRPQHHNRLELQDLAVIEQHLQNVQANSNIHALVLTASGPTFCAGFDLRALTNGDSLNDPQLLERVVNALETVPQPTLCALNGSVHGGGIDLALACDFRVGVQGMSAHMPAAKLGVHYYAHGMWRYVLKLQANAARRLLLLAEPFDTAELLRCGFLDEALPPEKFRARVQALIDRISSLPRTALQGMKEDIHNIENGHFDEIGINARWQHSLKSLIR